MLRHQVDARVLSEESHLLRCPRLGCWSAWRSARYFPLRTKLLRPPVGKGHQEECLGAIPLTVPRCAQVRPLCAWQPCRESSRSPQKLVWFRTAKAAIWAPRSIKYIGLKADFLCIEGSSNSFVSIQQLWTQRILQLPFGAFASALLVLGP